MGWKYRKDIDLDKDMHIVSVKDLPDGSIVIDTKIYSIDGALEMAYDAEKAGRLLDARLIRECVKRVRDKRRKVNNTDTAEIDISELRQQSELTTDNWILLDDDG